MSMTDPDLDHACLQPFIDIPILTCYSPDPATNLHGLSLEPMVGLTDFHGTLRREERQSRDTGAYTVFLLTFSLLF